MASPSTAYPVLSPSQQSSVIALPPTGVFADVDIYVPQKFYSDPGSALYSVEFITGAVDQISYTYNRLGGNILDVELQPRNIYALYEQAVLEYSYIINMHQAENSLSSFLGSTTASFDVDGNVVGALSGSNINLSFPKFTYSYVKKISDRINIEAKLNGSQTEYSASFDTQTDVQDYDLQEIITAKPEFTALIGDKRVEITKVFYQSPRAFWRFYAFYGGLTVTGNGQNYGQWADDSTFEVIPVWQHKLQAMAYENAIKTRLSHYSYELRNNKIRVFPTPGDSWTQPLKMWVRFYIPEDAWNSDSDSTVGGINNVNTLPFGNLPYDNINSMGKEWIRRYAFALALETLGYIRSKLDSIPIPGATVKLNGSSLATRGEAEQNRLRDQLREQLGKLTYSELLKIDSEKVDNAKSMLEKVPMPIYVG
jgi:hypothetical protein